jgi:hypothetical protein
VTLTISDATTYFKFDILFGVRSIDRYSFPDDGKRYSTANERIQAEVDRANKLADQLRLLGIDPDA